jgi:hypothetical protein
VLALVSYSVFGNLRAESARHLSEPRRLTASLGDTVVVPASKTKCVVSAEGGIPNYVCSRSGKHTYQVVFYRDNILVFKEGHPEDPVFSAHGGP